MVLSKLFEGRIDSGAAGAEATIRLKPRPGGRMCKVVRYDVKVIASSGDNVRITVALECGPDGTASAPHSTPINAAAPGSTFPAVVTGDADPAKIIGEWLHVALKIKDSAQPPTTAQWAMIEVYELRKPF